MSSVQTLLLPPQFSARSLLGLAPVPRAPRHAERQPWLTSFDRVGAVLDPRTAFFYGASVEAGHLTFLILPP
jgi:hypothetical protein